MPLNRLAVVRLCSLGLMFLCACASSAAPCGLPIDDACPDGCEVLGGYPVNQEDACFEEPESFVCMPVQEIALGIDACYENEAGDRWWALLYPFFSEPGWTRCDEDSFNLEPCE